MVSMPAAKAARRLTAVVVGLAAAGCSYQYDDGLPPLGQREAAAQASAEAAQASASASAAGEAAQRRERAARSALRAPLDQILSGYALRGWADTVLPDEGGTSVASGSGAVWPDGARFTLRAQGTPGDATLRFACRGTTTARIIATVEGAPAVDLAFDCNRPWARTVALAGSGAVDIAFVAGSTPSNVAYRLVRP
ncbi:hypothetical protein [Sinomonas flava]|uniref:Uncharacterized protein n=1 Tax=Sinomonas flava TaxID=496857 RepID=A0ABP5NUE0_9MICC